MANVQCLYLLILKFNQGIGTQISNFSLDSTVLGVRLKIKYVISLIPKAKTTKVYLCMFVSLGTLIDG